jgi:bifunctional NMN adenylyltransferase/nudix hydrolase
MENPKPNVGIVVGRFQVPMLHAGHLELLNKVAEECEKVVVVIGSSHAINTRRDPLDYRARELMIRSTFPDFTIAGIKDRRDDEMWSASLDGIINSIISPRDTVMLYGGRDSFIEHYKGQYKTTEVEPSIYYSGTQIREELCRNSIDSPEFRAGVVSAAYSRFPTTHPTVDMAVFNADKTQIILGAKPDDAAEGLWRLPGGFVDVDDRSLKAAAKRELREELGPIEVGDWEYVTDLKISDWRFRDQDDTKLHTVLFKCTHIFGSPTPGDDLSQAKWFDFNKKLLDPGTLVLGHIPLIQYLLKG